MLNLWDSKTSPQVRCLEPCAARGLQVQCCSLCPTVHVSMTFFEGARLCGNSAQSVSHGEGVGIAGLTGSCPSLPLTPSTRTTSSDHPRTSANPKTEHWNQRPRFLPRQPFCRNQLQSVESICKWNPFTSVIRALGIRTLRFFEMSRTT